MEAAAPVDSAIGSKVIGAKGRTRSEEELNFSLAACVQKVEAHI